MTQDNGQTPDGPTTGPNAGPDSTPKILPFGRAVAPAARKVNMGRLVGYVTAAAVGAGLLGLSLDRPNSAEAKQIMIAPPTGAPMSFADLIDKVSPAVVSVNTTGHQKSTLEGTPFEQFKDQPGFEEFRKFFEGRPNDKGEKVRSLGSGFFVSDSGHVVTNFHVIDGAETIKVVLKDGKELDAVLVGSDEATDLAVLKVTAPGTYDWVAFAKGPRARVGDWVVAVGNPFGLGGSASAGIVSADGRKIGGPYTDFLQIDAPINRGNSGGPTFDLRGNVVGVNTAIFSPSGGNVGIGFMIPSDTAARVVDTLIKAGSVTRGWLGVTIQSLDPDLAASLGMKDAKGAIINQVVPNGPAEKAGFRQGDVVLKLNGVQVEDNTDLTRQVGGLKVGAPANFEVLRGKERVVLRAIMGERPSEKKLATLNNAEPDAPPLKPGVPGAAVADVFGLQLQPPTPEERTALNLKPGDPGLVIIGVDPESRAAELGMRAGDLIVEAGRKPVRTAEDFTNAAASAKKEGLTSLLVLVRRRGSGADLYLALPFAAPR